MKLFKCLTALFSVVSVILILITSVFRYVALNVDSELNALLEIIITVITPFTIKIYLILGVFVLIYLFLRWCLFIKNKTLSLKKTVLYLPAVFLLYSITLLFSFDFLHSISGCNMALYEAKNVFTGVEKNFSSSCEAPFWYREIGPTPVPLQPMIMGQ